MGRKKIQINVMNYFDLNQTYIYFSVLIASPVARFFTCLLLSPLNRHSCIVQHELPSVANKYTGP